MAYILLIIVCGLELGILGRLSLTSVFVPNLFVVFLWAYAWFNTRRRSLPLAIIGGLLLDMALFSYFGVWTIIGVLTVMLIDMAKSRLLDASSILHALLALAGVSLIGLLLIAAAVRNFDYQFVLFGVLANVVVGVLVYYLLAMRLKLFSHWAGRRVEI